MSTPNPWLTTEELCSQLAISRSTLFAIKRSGLLKPGRHLVPKTPLHRVRTCSGISTAVSWRSGGSHEPPGVTGQGL